MSVKEHCCHKNKCGLNHHACDGGKKKVSGLVFLKVKISNYGKYSLIWWKLVVKVSDLIKC